MNYKEKIDYSSLSCYLECPRKFFFQYMMHFRSDRPSIHLVFGSCWHYGLEVAYSWLKTDPYEIQTSKDAREISISAFNHLWAIEGEPHFDPDLTYPKAPGRAADMYHKYWQQYLDEDTSKRILAVESPFTIDLSTIDENLPNYIGRIDLIMENSDQSLEIIDHKTASSISPITSPGFQSSLQTDGYLAAGNIYYDRIPEITYSVALCQKTKIAFERFTYSKRQSAIDRFITDLVGTCKDLHRNIDTYEEEKSIDSKLYCMQSFRRKPGYACTAYFSTCPYFDLCNARNNPATWDKAPPQGYTKNEWDPAEHEANLKVKLDEVK